MENQAAPSRRTKPSPRQRSSAGAAVARSFAKMPKPTKVAVMVKETGPSETFVMPKAIRGGERVLSAPVARFAALERGEEEPDQAAAEEQAAAEQDAAADHAAAE